MIVFHKVRYKNFLSTGNDFTEITLDDHDTTLIVGGNGMGKSSFMDAICYGLYNKAFRKINKPQLVNSINNKNCLVEIEFSVGSDDYIVRRGMKPNIFEIKKNGDLINQEANNRDYQEVLEKYILRLTYKSFCQVVILGSASFVPFMQLPTGQRREIIEDLLDIQIFTIMNMLLKDKSSQNSRDIQEIDYKYDLVSEKIKMHNDHLDSMKTNTDELITEYKFKINKHKQEIETEKSIIESKRIEQGSLLESAKDYDTLANKLSDMSSIRTKLRDKLDRIDHDISFFSEHENCPTCKQAIDELFRSQIVETKTSEHRLVGEGIVSMEHKYLELENKIKVLRKYISDANDLNIDINMKNTKIKYLEQSIKELEQQIESVRNRNDVYVSDNGTLKKLEEELFEVGKDKKDLIEVRDIYRISSMILKDSGIKAKIIKQYIPIINKLINKYLSSMDFFIQFELDENFNETIKSRFRDVFSYASFSEGEKMRIDLSLLFAWRTIAKLRNSASTNLLILDEIFDGSLDATGSDDFLNILYSVAGEANIFVISHKTDQMKDKFDRIIEFEKKNNFSRII